MTITRNQSLFTLIIVVAAIFRFWNLTERTLFAGEATTELHAIEQMVRGETSRLIGLYAATYVPGELHTTPWFLYLMTPFFQIFRGNPVAFMILHPLLGIVSIYFLYRAVSILVSQKTALSAEKRPTPARQSLSLQATAGGSRERIVREAGEWQAKAGLIAAALYATWMVVVNLDRSVWSLGLIPATVNFMMFAGAKAWTKQRRSWFIALGTILGFSISLHLQMLATTGFVLIFLWFTRRRFFMWTSIPVVLSFFPLFLFDLTHRFQNVSAFPRTLLSLLDGSRPYSTGYFIYQFLPWVTTATGVVLTRIHWKVSATALAVFLVVQLRSFLIYQIHPNFVERRALAREILEYWTPEKGLTVFINDRSYFEYGYLLLYYGRDRGVRANNVTKLEHPQPTQQLIEKVRAKAREIESKDVAFAQVKSKESLLLLDEDRLKLLPLSAFQFDINDTRKAVSPPK